MQLASLVGSGIDRQSRKESDDISTLFAVLLN